MRRSANVTAAVVACVAAMAAEGCMERCVAAPQPRLQSGIRIPYTSNAVEKVDLLLEVDNSRSMADNQANLARNFGLLIDRLVSPPSDPRTGRPQYPPVRSLHVGVISSDLGTPGTRVGSCANTDTGDDGLLNPIRNGLAMRQHEPWTGAPAGRRPARCTNDPNQYPSFLTFTAGATDAATFRDDFVCNAYLHSDGCGLEQQLESAYRALVVHDPRERPGNADPNAGFVRDDAVLAIVMVTDEEDGSVRDCRFAEAGVPCADALSVYDLGSSQWSHATDLNLRFYLYTPGSAQDPTWPIDRYIDPMRPNRGFTSLKPGRPDLVIFSAIAGVPLELPTRDGQVDYDALLGSNPDGSDGYVGDSAEGPVSMRQARRDACTTRVMPSCRRQGSAPTDSCDSAEQYFAQPSRRIAQVARRFAERYNNGTLSSVCANDYTPALQQVLERIQSRLAARCLPRALETTPRVCRAGEAPARDRCAGPGTPVRANCVVRELLPRGMSAARMCTRDRGRTVSGRDAQSGLDTCLVDQVEAPVGAEPASGARGFWYDTRPDPAAPDCNQNVRFTAGAELAPGATAVIECINDVGAHDEAPAEPQGGGSCG